MFINAILNVHTCVWQRDDIRGSALGIIKEMDPTADPIVAQWCPTWRADDGYGSHVTWSSECGTEDTGFAIIDFHSLRCFWKTWCNTMAMWVMLDVLAQLFGYETSGDFYLHMIWEAPARLNSGGASFSKPGCPGCCAGLGGFSHWRVGALRVSRSQTKDIPETTLCSFAKSNLTIQTFWSTKLDKIQMHQEKCPSPYPIPLYWLIHGYPVSLLSFDNHLGIIGVSWARMLRTTSFGWGQGLPVQGGILSAHRHPLLCSHQWSWVLTALVSKKHGHVGKRRRALDPGHIWSSLIFDLSCVFEDFKQHFCESWDAK